MMLFLYFVYIALAITTVQCGGSKDYDLHEGFVLVVNGPIECVGVLVDDYRVVLSAFCVQFAYEDTVDVIVGRKNIRDENEDGSKKLSIDFDNIHTHDGYDLKYYTYPVSVICLPQLDNIKTRQIASDYDDSCNIQAVTTTIPGRREQYFNKYELPCKSYSDKCEEILQYWFNYDISAGDNICVLIEENDTCLDILYLPGVGLCGDYVHSILVAGFTNSWCPFTYMGNQPFLFTPLKDYRDFIFSFKYQEPKKELISLG